jgi:hypothetical protein
MTTRSPFCSDTGLVEGPVGNEVSKPTIRHEPDV